MYMHFAAMKRAMPEAEHQIQNVDRQRGSMNCALGKMNAESQSGVEYRIDRDSGYLGLFKLGSLGLH